jgi:hypothetical protein
MEGDAGVFGVYFVVDFGDEAVVVLGLVIARSD